MIELQKVTAEEIYQKHRTIPVRCYEEDWSHRQRVAVTRSMIKYLLDYEVNPGAPNKAASIVELGCGTGDLSGPFSKDHRIMGYDASADSLGEAAYRFPHISAFEADIQVILPRDCDLLILGEVLEHLKDPEAVLADWLPKSRFCVSSAPIEGDIGGDMSGGEHVWSFGEGELQKMITDAGHGVIQKKKIDMGSYKDLILASKRTEEATQ